MKTVYRDGVYREIEDGRLQEFLDMGFILIKPKVEKKKTSSKPKKKD